MFFLAIAALLGLRGLHGSPMRGYEEMMSESVQKNVAAFEFPPSLPALPPSMRLSGKAYLSPVEAKIQELIQQVDRSQAKKSTDYFPKVG